MDVNIIAQVQAFGFAVYMRDVKDTYMFFTKDDKIGYLQENHFSGWSVSSVHKPSRACGTGYNIVDQAKELTEELLWEACTTVYPAWALPLKHRGDPGVVKYKNLDEFLNRDSFNKDFKLIPPS